MPTDQLPLHAELLLIAHDPKSGKPRVDSTHFKAGLAGAAVIELALQEALRLDGEGNKAKLVANDADIDSSLAEVLARADGHTPKKAITRIGGGVTCHDRTGELRHATFGQLEARELGRLEEDKVLGIFPTRRWVEADTGMRESIVDRLRGAIASSDVPERRTACLVSITQAMGLLTKLLPDLDKKGLTARAKEIGEGDWGGDAVAKAIQDVEAAVTVAVMVPMYAGGGDG